MIPEFNENGNLPPGIHWVEWEEFKERFGYNNRRVLLMAGLEERDAGVTRSRM